MKTLLHKPVFFMLTLLAMNLFLTPSANGQSCNVIVTSSGSGTGSCAPTGIIILYGSGVSFPHTYSLDGITYQSSNTFNGLAAGTYTGYVKNSVGCVGTKSNIIVTTIPPMTMTATPREASSCANNGSIELFRSGGTPPYSYSLDDITYQSSNMLSNLSNGTYTGWIQDAKGCKVSLPGIVVTKVPALTLTSAKGNTSACANNGAIQLFAGGGTPAYTYSLDDITYQSGSLFLGLAAGTYNGWVKDTRGCKTAVSSIVIGTDPASVITVIANPRNSSSCAIDGIIELYRSGGTPPYTYSLDDITYQSSSIFTGLPGGTYTAWIKDARGCKGSLSGISVIQPPTLTVTENHGNVSTCVVDGTIQLHPSGGTGPYSYSLDDITYQPGNGFGGLNTGSYTGWVKDWKGCKASVNSTLTQNLIIVTAYTVAASNCVATNGSIQLFRTGGLGPYTYSLDNITYKTSNLFSNLGQGNYTGYVKDSKGCIGTLAVITVGPPNATIQLASGAPSAAQGICKSSNISNIYYLIGNGGTGATVTGLPAGVTGSFSGGLFTISGGSTVPGIYNYTVTTTGTCTGTIVHGTITVYPPPTASFTKTMASACAGGSDGTITIIPSGTGPFTYSWTGANGFTGNTATVTGLSSGDYTSLVSDAHSCSVNMANITIWQAELPVLTHNAANTGSCGPTGIISLFGSYGVPPFTYSLDGTNYQVGKTFINLAAGTYTGYVKDLGGCVGSKQITINTVPPPVFTTYARAATNCVANNGFIQLYLSLGGNGPYSYSINGSTFNTSPAFSNLAPGTYTGYVKDGTGCVASISNLIVGPTCFAAGNSNETATGKLKDNGKLLQEDHILKINAYPNPSTAEFTLIPQSSSREDIFITVKDIAGKRLLQVAINSNKSYRFGNELKPGIYMVEVIQGNEKQVLKLVKQ